MSPDNTVRAAGLMGASATTMLNRTNILINYGYGEHYVNDNGTPSMFHHGNDKLNINSNRTPYIREGTKSFFPNLLRRCFNVIMILIVVAIVISIVIVIVLVIVTILIITIIKLIILTTEKLNIQVRTMLHIKKI